MTEINSDEMTNPALVAFAAMARPVMRRFMTPNSCIAASRVTIETLKHFGIRARPVPSDFTLTVPSTKYVYMAGFRGRKAGIKQRAASWVDRNVGENGWEGHVVVLAEERWLLDATLDQATSHEHGFEMESQILLVDLNGKEFSEQAEMTLGLALDCGTDIELYYHPTGDMSFTSSEAWNDTGLPILAAALAIKVKRMLKELEATKKTPEGNPTVQ